VNLRLQTLQMYGLFPSPVFPMTLTSLHLGKATWLFWFGFGVVPFGICGLAPFKRPFMFIIETPVNLASPKFFIVSEIKLDLFSNPFCASAIDASSDACVVGECVGSVLLECVGLSSDLSGSDSVLVSVSFSAVPFSPFVFIGFVKRLVL
jgi:hypothetical protein